MSTYLSDLFEQLSNRLEEVLTGDRYKVQVIKLHVKSGVAYIAVKDISAIVKCKRLSVGTAAYDHVLEIHMKSGTIFTVEDDI
tara:strand:+ start:1565 stop:1813 length:249 start_codon:yes stop_codon:yes gene_type:complete